MVVDSLKKKDYTRSVIQCKGMTLSPSKFLRLRLSSKSLEMVF